MTIRPLTGRELLAIFVTPVLPASVVTLSAGSLADEMGALTTLFVAYLYGIAIVAALGVLPFLVLRQLNLVRWWSAALSGLIAALIVIAVLNLKPIELFIPLGVLSGLLFLVVARTNGAQQGAPGDGPRAARSARA